MLFRFLARYCLRPFCFKKISKVAMGPRVQVFAVSVLAVPLRFSGAEHENEYFVRTFF